MLASFHMRWPWRLVQCLVLASIVFAIYTLYDPAYGKQISLHLPGLSSFRISNLNFASPTPDSDFESADHPIHQLIETAKRGFAELQGKRVTTLDQAAKEYRRRRGRHPPPAFDKWFEFAINHDAVLVEDFFDQVYHDIEPFWGLRPYELRRQAKGFRPKLSVRKGTLNATPNINPKRMKPWKDLLGQLYKNLPDIDIPVNLNYEPSLIIPLDLVEEHMIDGKRLKVPVTDLLDAYSGLHSVDALKNLVFRPSWLDPRGRSPTDGFGPRLYWKLVRPACRSDSKAADNGIWYDISSRASRPRHPIESTFPTEFPHGTFKGYIQNWTIATDPCNHPHLQGLYGNFVRPRALTAYDEFIPLFSASKYAINNDILLPSPEDWSLSIFEEETRSLPWTGKKNILHWRGPASGGANSVRNWRRFHRHRFVSMMNCSQIAIAEETLQSGNSSMRGLGPAKNFRLLPNNDYNLENYNRSKGHGLADWVESWSDVQFTNMVCDTKSKLNPIGRFCAYNRGIYELAEDSGFEKSIEVHKYIPILDGDGAADGFLDVLRSTSVPIKASLFRNWYDSRIVPWVHFVPMDNTFMDIYGIMEYFVGTDIPAHKGQKIYTWDNQDKSRNRNGHDEAARRIAMAGHDWSRKVLRREDMLIYVWRLLIEYARVIDDRRERMGWVGDLLDELA